MIIIGLVGHIASGKGTIVSCLKETYGGKQYRFSKILDDILIRLYKENSRDNEINLAIKLRELYGDDVLARVLADDIKKEKPDVAVVDGIRYPLEVEALQTLPGFKLVAVITDEEARYQRTLLRGEKADELGTTREEFKKLHERPTEIYIDELIEKADSTITNNGTLEDLKKQVAQILKM